MTRKSYLISTFFLILIGLVILFELIRDSGNTGDFLGYVNAGNAVLEGRNIYFDVLNTWPPLFSLFSVPLALVDQLSSYFIRFLWLLGSVISLYYIISILSNLIFKKPISFFGKNKGVLIQDTLILIPLLIILRYIMDNMANVQINTYMVLCALLAIVCFIKKKYKWVGFILALTISLKVYTIFFLLYFLFKREFKPVLWTLIFVVLLNSICFMVFGFDQAIEYYQTWVKDVTPRSYIAHHKNQSLFGMFLRLFSTDHPEGGLYFNIMNIGSHAAIKLTYISVCVAAIFPAYLFRKKLTERTNFHALLEYSCIFTAIPLLSPITWKAYFIFLIFPYFILYAVLYRVKTDLNTKSIIFLKGLFWLSVVFTVFSTEAIVGHDFSDVMESYNCITIGTIILLLMQLFIVIKIKCFDLNSIRFRELPNKNS